MVIKTHYPRESGWAYLKQAGEKVEKRAPSVNSDFFGKPFLASGTPANPMSEPEGRVLDLQ